MRSTKLRSTKVALLATHCRYWFALLVLLIATLAVLFTRQPSITSYVIGLIALTPMLFLLLQLLRKNATQRLISIPALIIAGLVIGFIAFFSQGLFRLHNGYPIPLLIITVIWWQTAVVLLIAPSRRSSLEKITDSSRNYARSLSILIIPVFVLMWIAFTQFIVHKAEVIASDGDWCIRETDKTHLRSALWLSPRKMFFENNYKGTISPYLLLKVDGDPWSHHWSFAAMNFVPNETSAFLGGLSFFKTRQTEKPC